jgi:hypothetical protein
MMHNFRTGKAFNIPEPHFVEEPKEFSEDSELSHEVSQSQHSMGSKLNPNRKPSTLSMIRNNKSHTMTNGSIIRSSGFKFC